MIEGFGEELPEPEMADAIMEAHRLNQEIIALQFDLLEAVGLPLPERRRDAARPAPAAALRSLRRRASETTKQIVHEARAEQRHQGVAGDDRQGAVPGGRATAFTIAAPQAGDGDGAPVERARDAGPDQGGVLGRRGAGGSRADPGRQAARRPRARATCGPSSARSGLLPRAHGSALFQRGRDPGPGDHRAGHRRRRAARRRHHGRVQQEVHARLQHAPLRGRRDPADSRARPPRDRPWRAGRAVGRADLAASRAISRTRSAWSPTSSNPTVRARWPRSAAPRSA